MYVFDKDLTLVKRIHDEKMNRESNDGINIKPALKEDTNNNDDTSANNNNNDDAPVKGKFSFQGIGPFLL